MVHPEKKHFVIVGRTLGVQVLLFIGILLAVWGAQKLYTAIDPARFPAYQVEVKEGMTENEKGAALLTALTHRLDSELNSTFGWTANDILFNRWIMDNRAYRQFGEYVATKMLFDHYSTVIAKLGSNDRENNDLYSARLNHIAISPQRWGYLFIPSAEGSYKKALKLADKYKADLLAGKAVYNCRTDDIYSAYNLILGETVLGYALGLLNNSQDLPFYTLDNRIYEAQGVVLVVRDYLKAMYELYPEIAGKGNEQNWAEAMRYMDLICNYDPLYITSSFNSGELIISYLLFTQNRLADIRDSLRI
ncbi:DUF2333 family protein [Mailhella sp.]|uniref:DUF2333 family protein n=1 Tax=Mailhella sp. TaxID=1981029 RepID=UPI004063A7D1